MIENSYVVIESDGKRVTVIYFEDEQVSEGPAIFPARYSSFAVIIQYCETQFNTRRLDVPMRSQIEGLLGSPWPAQRLSFRWKDCPEKDCPEFLFQGELQ
jgi:hypothetical protein